MWDVVSNQKRIHCWTADYIIDQLINKLWVLNKLHNKTPENLSLLKKKLQYIKVDLRWVKIDRSARNSSVAKEIWEQWLSNRANNGVGTLSGKYMSMPLVLLFWVLLSPCHIIPFLWRIFLFFIRDYLFTKIAKQTNPKLKIKLTVGLYFKWLGRDINIYCQV